MVSELAQIIEQRGDWLDEAPRDVLFEALVSQAPVDSYELAQQPDSLEPEKLRPAINSTTDADDLIERVLDDGLEAGPGGSRGEGHRLSLKERFLDELHAFLCPLSGHDQYKEDRRKLLDEYKAGQTTFVAGVSATLVPVLGTGYAPPIAAAIAVAFTLIARIGLAAWCAAQRERIASRPKPGNIVSVDRPQN